MTVPKRTQRSKAARKGEPHSRMYFKQSGRAYGDFRAWEPWGGKLEALIPEGEAFATKNQIEAAVLFGRRLEGLREERTKHPGETPVAVAPAATIALDRLAPYIAYHIICKKSVTGPKRAEDNWIKQCEKWLVEAAIFFAKRGLCCLADINTAQVQDWWNELASSPTRPLAPETQRKMLDALGSMFRRAVSEQRVLVNPVVALMDKPTGGPSKTEFLELPEAALLLEACRIWEAARADLVREIVAALQRREGA